MKRTKNKGITSLLARRLEGVAGTATIFWENGDHYIGQIYGNRLYGNGIYYFAAEKVTYDGNWNMDVRTGKGKCTFANGDVYVGDWENNMRHGSGKLVFGNGDVYEGEWKNDRRHGIGRVHFVGTDSEYFGAWQYDLRHGKGKCVYVSRNYYNGNWVEGKRDGNGIFYALEENRTYNGEWSDNQMHGFGQETLANGDVYCGLWQKNEKHGEGILYYVNGDVVEGEWESDQLVKELSRSFVNPLTVTPTTAEAAMEVESTTICHLNGDVYTGTVDNSGKEHGIGQLVFTNKNVFVGEFTNGCMHGYGIMYFPDGSNTTGQWLAGVQLPEEVTEEFELEMEEEHKYQYEDNVELDEEIAPENYAAVSQASASAVPDSIVGMVTLISEMEQVLESLRSEQERSHG